MGTGIVAGSLLLFLAQSEALMCKVGSMDRYNEVNCGYPFT